MISVAHYTINATNPNGRPFAMIGIMPLERAVAKGAELRSAGFKNITLISAVTLIESELDNFLPDAPNPGCQSE